MPHPAHHLKTLIRGLTIAGLTALVLVTPPRMDPVSAADPVEVDVQYQTAFQRSYISEATGNYAESIRPLERLVRLRKHAQDYILILRLGWLNYRRGDNRKAIQYYRRATELKREAIEPWLGLLLPLFGAGQYHEAVKVGEIVLAKDKLNYLALARVARCYYVLQRYNKAAEYYARIVDLYPGDVQMRAGLAWSYLRAGLKNKARAQFRLVLAVNPSYFARIGFYATRK
jgi:tetratricopeptide (TPR) repeat protein